MQTFETSFESSLGGFAAGMGALSIVWFLFVLVVTVLFAIGVFSDADRRRKERQPVVLVPPFVWFLGALVGSFLVVALYWALHYSSLRGAGGEQPPAA